MVRRSPPSQSCAAAPGDCSPGEGEARGGSSGRCCGRVSSPRVGGDGARFLGRGGSQEELLHFSLGARQSLADVHSGGRQC